MPPCTPGGTVTDQAEYWWARLRAPDCTAKERVAFEIWRAADPAHRRIYAETAALWDEFGGLLPASHPVRAEARAYWESRRLAHQRWDRRGFLAFTAAAMLVVAVPAAWWVWQAGNQAQAYTTAKGERRTAPLADGSRIELNTDTHLAVRLKEHLRRVVLWQGEAYFEVAPDPARPFVVSAGLGRVRALGTRFNVYASAEEVSVALLEGRVEVELSEKATGQRLLQPGQQLAYDKTGFSPITRVDTEIPLPWREGRLVFRSTPLSEVLREVARYRTLHVEVRDPALLDLRVSGNFRCDDIHTLLEALPKALPIDLVSLPSDTVLITPRRGR